MYIENTDMLTLTPRVGHVHREHTDMLTLTPRVGHVHREQTDMLTLTPRVGHVHREHKLTIFILIKMPIWARSVQPF